MFYARDKKTEALIVSFQLVIQFLYSGTLDQPRDQVAILEVSV